MRDFVIYFTDPHEMKTIARVYVTTKTKRQNRDRTTAATVAPRATTTHKDDNYNTRNRPARPSNIRRTPERAIVHPARRPVAMARRGEQGLAESAKEPLRLFSAKPTDSPDIF